MNKLSRFYSLDFWILLTLGVLLTAFVFIFNVPSSDKSLKIKSYKKNAAYYYKKNLTRRVLCHQKFYSKEIKKLIESPSLFFDKATYFFKSKYKNKETAIVPLENLMLIVHKYHKNSIWDVLTSLFYPSKAFLGWHYGNLLLKHSILCSKPLLLIEETFGPFCTTSYLVTQYIDGVSADAYFSKLSAYSEKWDETIKNLETSLTELYNLGVIHQDLVLKSIIIKNDIPYFIDLDKLKSLPKSNNDCKPTLNRYFSSLCSELSKSKSPSLTLFEEKSLLFEP